MNGISRRQLLRLGVMSGAGLVLVVRLTDAAPETGAPLAAGAAPQLHPLIRIPTDGAIELFAQNPERGQGVKTSLPMIRAEELDVRFEDVVVRQSDWLPGPDLQFSGGSLSIRLNYQAMREAGASARHMLLQAAADRWQVPIERLVTEAGRVRAPEAGLSAAYGELAAEASRLPVPDSVPLRQPADFRVIGISRSDVDLPAILTGRPLFGFDLKRPGMLCSVVRHSPFSDGQVASLDDTAARALPGVHDVYTLSNEQSGGRVILPNSPNFGSGVAVLAHHTWAALQGARALEVQWRAPADLEDTTKLYERFHESLDSEAAEVRRDGKPEPLLADGHGVFEEVYRVPFLAHAPMEPMNCTARFDAGRVELWAPTQNPGGLAAAVSKALGIGAGEVTVHVLRSGGAFGRRHYSDFAVEASSAGPYSRPPGQGHLDARGGHPSRLFPSRRHAPGARRAG